MWDVLVAGAGPAGAVAAYVLARSGRRVLLANSVDPKVPKFGEALPGAAVRLLRSIGLPAPNSADRTCRSAAIFRPGMPIELIASDFFREPNGPGWRLDRASLRRAAARRSS